LVFKVQKETQYSRNYRGFRILKESEVSDPLVSTLIRVKNEAANIDQFLESLYQQTIFARTQVIILDSGSTDGTLEKVMSFPASVCAIEPQEFSFGSSCNLVCSLATGPILSLMSGHVALKSRKLLASACEALSAEGDLAAAYARQVPNPAVGASSYERAFLKRRFLGGTGKVAMGSRQHSFSNAGSFFTKESWRIIPFPDVGASEDFLWAEKLLAAGGRLFYLPECEVEHSHNEMPHDVYKRVKINIAARNGAESRPYTALKYLFGVTGACMLEGAGPVEAVQFGWAHALPYLSR
jgi:rhamnosyltransferase